MFTVEATVHNANHVLTAGMVATVHVEDQTAELSPSVVVVPLSAVLNATSLKGYGVYVLRSNQGKTTARVQPVRIGKVLGDRISIEEGVTPGDHIVKDAGLQIIDGETVREIL